jgi:uncharacterized protein (DUF1778 family)
MASKTDRIEMRAAPEQGEYIAKAATAVGHTVSGFVLEASLAAADRVFARADRTLMAAEQFDQLIQSLDRPDEAPKLREATQRERRFRRS